MNRRIAEALYIALVLVGTGSAVAYAVDRPNFVVILTDDQSWVGSSQEGGVPAWLGEVPRAPQAANP